MNKSALTTAARARLLRMLMSRPTTELAILVVVPIVAWFYGQKCDPSVLMAWGLAVGAFAICMLPMRMRFNRDQAQLADAALLKKWEPIFKMTGLGYGLAWGGVVVITSGADYFEFSLLLHAIVAIYNASAATYLTPIFAVFLRFFATSWLIAVVMVFWTFPQHWHFILPLSLLYGFSVFRNAQTANHFFEDQARLEESSVHLAQQYKTAKDEAEHALKTKTQFLTTASHDLRQPVHAMGMLIEAMQQRNQDARMSPLLVDLHSCVRSVNLMFNSLLDLSKIEAGIAQQQPVIFLLNDVLQDVVTLFRQEAATRQLQIRLRLPRGNAYVFADPMLVRQALTNLTHNAIRYTLQGGVLLSARRRQGQWQMEVWDTGIGVAAGDHAQIYSPYYRHAQAWRMDSAGHGLGLAVVAQCAQLMGAQYGIASRLGQGSRFWLALPVAAAPPHALGEKAQPAAQSQASHSMHARNALQGGRCLVVEDDPQINAAWAVLMETWQLDARFATCAQEAFAHIDQGFVPQVVLCDQRLRAGESGFDILQTLLMRCPDAHGAMVSGEFNAPELLRAEEEGFIVLRKPIDMVALHTLLSRWLG